MTTVTTQRVALIRGKFIQCFTGVIIIFLKLENKLPQTPSHIQYRYIYLYIEIYRYIAINIYHWDFLAKSADDKEVTEPLNWTQLWMYEPHLARTERFGHVWNDTSSSILVNIIKLKRCFPKAYHTFIILCECDCLCVFVCVRGCVCIWNTCHEI